MSVGKKSVHVPVSTASRSLIKQQSRYRTGLRSHLLAQLGKTLLVNELLAGLVTVGSRTEGLHSMLSANQGPHSNPCYRSLFVRQVTT